MGGDEVLQGGEPLAEVGADGQVDDTTRGIGHEAAHSGELPNRLHSALGRTRVDHDAQGAVRIEIAYNCRSNLFGCLGPELHRFHISLIVCDEATAILSLHLRNPGVDLLKDGRLFRGNVDVIDGDGDTGEHGVLEANILDGIHQTGGTLET